MTDDWSNQEIVRAIQNMTHSVDGLRDDFTKLDQRFVLREVYSAERSADRALAKQTADAVEGIAKSIAAGQTSRLNFLVYPIVGGLVLAVMLWAIFKK